MVECCHIVSFPSFRFSALSWVSRCTGTIIWHQCHCRICLSRASPARLASPESEKSSATLSPARPGGPDGPGAVTPIAGGALPHGIVIARDGRPTIRMRYARVGPDSRRRSTAAAVDDAYQRGILAFGTAPPTVVVVIRVFRTGIVRGRRLAPLKTQPDLVGRNLLCAGPPGRSSTAGLANLVGRDQMC